MKTILIIFGTLFSLSVFCQNQNSESNKVYQIFYHPNGNISSEGILNNGKPDGLWKSYYVDGSLKSIGQRLYGLLDSVWIFYTNDSLIKEKISYLNGKKNGYYYSFNFFKNKDSITISYIEKKELYLNNVKSGLSTYYSNNGLINKTVFYKNGKRNGITKEYDKHGNLVTVINYKDGREISRDVINRMNDSLKVGIWKEFYDNGRLKRELNYSDGKLHGLIKEYDLIGELILSHRYVNGILIDSIVDIEQEIDIVEKFYNLRDSTGEFIKRSSGGFINGIPVGVHRTYDSLGRVNSSILYDSEGNIIGKGIVDIEGNKVGDWFYYYKNGNIKSVGKYKNNKRFGFWKYYFINKRVEQQGSFLNGKPSGDWKWYFETGNLQREEYYIDGKEEGEAFEYDEFGNVIINGFYLEGLKEGKWFFDFEFHTEKGNFSNGLRNGEWTYYYKNGNIYFIGSFINDLENGYHFYYYKNGQLKEKRYYLFGRKDSNWEYYDYYGSLLKILTFDNNILIKIDGLSVETE